MQSCCCAQSGTESFCLFYFDLLLALRVFCLSVCVVQDSTRSQVGVWHLLVQKHSAMGTVLLHVSTRHCMIAACIGLVPNVPTQQC